MKMICRFAAISVLSLMSFVQPCAAEAPSPHSVDASGDGLSPTPLQFDGGEGAGPQGEGLRLRPEILMLSQVGSEDLGPGTEEVEYGAEIADPLEPVNRAFYTFNDKLYFWVMKPVAKGYNRVFPEPMRVSFNNFFSNIATPIRVVNAFLQADFKGAGTEVFRFVVNTTMGVFGFGDAGREVFGVEKREADFGQTLGVYGLGPAFFINWPFLGPSDLRDSFGYAGDYFLDPVNYTPFWTEVGAKGTDRVNSTSLMLGRYESLKRAALDPYISLRNAYHMYRLNQIKEGKRQSLLFSPSPSH